VTPITGTFLVLNILIWLIYLGSGQPGSWRGAFLVPGEFSPVSLVTSQFLHQSALHLALNMLLLWKCGRPVERGLGSGLYFVLYIGSGLFAGLLHVAVAHLFRAEAELHMAAGGASGAVAGVMGAYAAIYPSQRIRISPWGLGVSAVTVILVWLGWEAAQAIVALQKGLELGVGHWAHVGGLVFGLVIGPAMSAGARDAATSGALEAEAELPDGEESRFRTAMHTSAVAVERLTKVGEREYALSLYRQAIEDGRPLRLPGPVEFRIADWLAEERDWSLALDAFLGVSNSESEPELAATALYRAIQIAEEHLRRPQLVERLRQELRFRYPKSRWST
jgi:membrane associated rhomboid family serine protease